MKKGDSMQIRFLKGAALMLLAAMVMTFAPGAARTANAVKKNDVKAVRTKIQVKQNNDIKVTKGKKNT